VKLTELEPSWCSQGSDRHGMGISFLCPHCHETHLAVWFTNPLDGGPPIDDEHRPFKYLRTGDTFETLTLRNPNSAGPHSINFESSGHWHGHITNGEVI
jgi:hypothetical protein